MTKTTIEQTEKQIRDKHLKEIEDFMHIISDFIDNIPNEVYYLKSYAAERIATEAVIFGASNHYEGLGIFEEAMLSYRQTSKEILEEEAYNEKEEEDLTTMIKSINPKKIAQA
jgi:hypothetical protein